MTIDEAISHAEEEAERQEYLSTQNHGYCEEKWNIKARERCAKRAAEHRQLAEWLKELKEAKRLLKMAVEDISKMPCNNDTHSPDSCYICVKHGNCSYADSFKWCKADMALKLIGESNEP